MKSVFSRKNKDDGGGEDPNRSALFGSRKPKDSSANNSNPYAQGGSDPYTSPPPPYGNNNSNPSMERFRQEKSPVPPGGYGGGASTGGDRYGASSGNSYGGYGAGGDRYGAGSGSATPASRYGAGGYGGFGGAPSGSSDRYGGGSAYGARNNDADPESRQQLFGNAPQRVAQQQNQGAPPDNSSNSWQSGVGPNYGQDQGYGQRYDDRQLTAEEQEEEDIQAAKQEIRFIKQQDVSSTRNALRIAQQAEETGRQTLARLGEQSERIHSTERNLDLASNQNRLAAEKARELKTLNRSMFAVHVSNPFTSAKRTQERENAVLDQARKDRETRDATRAAAWSSSARHAEFGRQMNPGQIQAKKGGSLAERSKYQFEADSEDEAMEEEIDQNLDLLHGAAKRLNGLAGAMGREVDEQNRHIDRIGGKVDRVDDEIALNRSRLDGIR